MGLVTTTSEFKTHVPNAASNFDFDAILPIIELVELDLIKKILGSTFYSGLVTRKANTTLTADETTLLPYIQRAISFLALYDYIAFGNINMNNGGFTVNAGQNFAPASTARTEDLKDATHKLGHKACEILIAYLVENKDLFADYASSDAYAEAVECFINSATDFSYYFNIRNDRWLFWHIKPIVKRIEGDHIKSRLGATLYDQIKSQISTNSVSANNLKLMPYIKTAVANLAIAESIDELGLKIDAYGLTMATSGTTNAQTVVLRNPATPTNMSLLKEKCVRIGNGKLGELEQFLFNNHADYPGYENDVYEADAPTDIENSESNSHYNTIVS